MNKTIELHYYFEDNTHSMNAFSRNKAEAELLAVLKRSAELLGIGLELEAQALSEGGLKEILKFLGDNSTQINILLVVAALLLTRVPAPSDPEQDALTLQLTRLGVEEKQLQIERLKRELGETNVDRFDQEKASRVIAGDPKILIRRSNFFHELIQETKIDSIGVSPFAADGGRLLDEQKVLRADFPRFILQSRSLDPQIIDDAKIEIISPVLKEDRFRWKGIFEGESIGFEMQDADFKTQVLNEKVTFQHGTCIECVLVISRKLDEVGDLVVTGYAVTTVIRKFDDRQSIETRQGRSYRQAQKLREGQEDLFSRQDD